MHAIFSGCGENLYVFNPRTSHGVAQLTEEFSKGWVWIKNGCEPEDQTQDAEVKTKFGEMRRLFSDMKRKKRAEG